MIQEEDFFETVEAYEENRLTKPQRSLFEAQLQTDPALKSALTDYRVFRHSLEAVDLKQRLDALHTQLEQSGTLMKLPPPYKPARTPWGLWHWVAAASVVMAVGLWLGLTQPWIPRPDAQVVELTQAAFAEFYRPEPVIRGSTDCPAGFAQTVDQYRAGQYRLVLANLEKESANNVCTLYYRGLCQLALHEQGATASLQAAQQQSSGSLRQRIDWYLALAYLSTNDVGAARRELQKISQQGNHSFGPVARQVLDRVKR